MAARNLAGSGTCDCLGAVAWGAVRAAGVGAGVSVGVVEPDPYFDLDFTGAEMEVPVICAAGDSELIPVTAA